MDNSEAIKRLKDQMQDLLPTPPVGWSVQWLERNNEQNPRGAMVTRVEGPGRIELTVFGPRAVPSHKQGVYHVDAPIHEDRNAGTLRNGSWRYLPGTRAPKEHYDLHREDLERQIKLFEDQQRRWDEAKAAKEAKEQEKEAATA